ncbi:acetyl-CoA carboxylase biotin carboxyl carrier protein [Vagococcus sp. BWB3-3]|uniref:Biotin carboxyl carrier protein of acetyl-CoA carboxylase n=1 Tax=Vagococcus allomyrinae TaxID=2794353 RepID=A0A940PDG3_9ENTE|nr:acetyl-CoA carboxylase biotin carboxyl carrier protein [Vagococcus allomyrinae]MBP1041928.1 acetyl-CoA carboxylase biotin carboxyl carrier protein [Vagococcus allomyrinae]
MEFADLKELLVQFDESTIREFDLNKGDFHLYLSKNEQRVSAQPLPVAVGQTPAVETAEVISAPVQPADVAVAVEAGQTVDSPLVGVAYLSGAPGEAAFKQVGDKVAIGDTLCIVEAMKIMNEINSDVAGTVTEILIQNEDVVEYGQALFRIV